MIRLLLPAFFFLLLQNASAQTGSFAWVNQAFGEEDDIANAICADGSGNVYATGRSASPWLLIGNSTLSLPPVSWHFLIVKYDPNGNMNWARGASSGEGAAITADRNGNVFAAGSFEGPTMSFGTITLFNAHPGLPQMFVVKYDPTGNLLWARTSSGSAQDRATSIGADSSGNIFVGGYYSGSSISFGTESLLNNYPQYNDMFLLKYGTGGNAMWAQNFASSDMDYLNDLAVDHQGHIAITGTFRGSALTMGSYTVPNARAGKDDLFVARIDGYGGVEWVKTAGDSSFDVANSICIDQQDNITIGGMFQSGTISFSSFTLNNPLPGQENCMIARFDTSGNVLWAVNGGIYGNYTLRDVACDPVGNVYTTGWYTSGVLIGNSLLPSMGMSDMLVAKYHISGNPAWAISIANTEAQYGNSICTDPFGAAYVTGCFFSATLDVGIKTLVNTDTPPCNTSDFFVAAISVITSTNEAPSVTSTLFPNPASNEFFIKGYDSRNAEVRIYSAQGTVVQQILHHDTQSPIRIDLPAGLYFVECNDEQGRSSTSLIVE